MYGHKTVRQRLHAARGLPPMEDPRAFCYPQQTLPFLVIDKDVFASVPAGGDVIDSAGEFDAQWAGHGATLWPKEAKGKACPQD